MSHFPRGIREAIGGGPPMAAEDPCALGFRTNPADELLSGEDWIRLATQTGLTPAEVKVAVYLVQGNTRMEIAQKLSCAKGTVRVHIDRIFTKLKARDRCELVLRVVQIHLQTRDKATG